MITKNITFEDLEGNQITQPFYFNVSKAELIKLQTKEKNGLDRKLRQIANNQDVNGLITTINEFIEMSYGEKSEDGIAFIKQKNGVRLVENFMNTDAYSKLFEELVSDPDKLMEFIIGILPKDLAAQAQAEIAKNPQLMGSKEGIVATAPAEVK